MNDARDLAGRRYLVTGAAAGIGRETARLLAERGAEVVVSAREASRADALARELGNGASGLALDVADLDSIRIAALTLADRFERIDGLANNAGILVDRRQTTPSGIELTWATNVLGPFALTRALLPLLRAAPEPRVVDVGSIAHAYGRLEWSDLQYERRRFALFSAYNQSKLALVLLTRAFAKREPAIASVCVHPGAINTGIFRSLWPPVRAAIGRFFPTAAVGAIPVVRLLAERDPLRFTGAYFDKLERKEPKLPAGADADADRLWSLLEAQADAA